MIVIDRVRNIHSVRSNQLTFISHPKQSYQVDSHSAWLGAMLCTPTIDNIFVFTHTHNRHNNLLPHKSDLTNKPPHLSSNLFHSYLLPTALTQPISLLTISPTSSYKLIDPTRSIRPLPLPRSFRTAICCPQLWLDQPSSPPSTPHSTQITAALCFNFANRPLTLP